jgi:uncharacterized protein (DUF488 family)
MMESIYTIGHSTHTMERLIQLLEQHHVTALADVRSQPYSRMNPQFNREVLKTSLRQAGIAYVFLGQQLGARAEDPACYRDGRVQYDLLARTEPFREGLRRLQEGAQTHRIALMCAEKEPLHCHRTILISRHLVEAGLDVRHILADGEIEDHRHAMSRLVKLLKLQGDDLFRSPEEIEELAYRLQGEAMAFQAPSDEGRRKVPHVR